MRRINYFAMSLLASAALAFTGCSSEDVINGGTEKNDAVDGFYMTLTVKTPQANQTRTSNEDRKTEEGTEAETTITKGTFYLYKGTTLVYTKSVVATDWVGDKGVTKDGKGVTKPIKVSVNNVNLGDYDVYFLAGDKVAADPLNNEFSSEKGGADYANDGNFVMFNQNDSQRAAAHGKVTFTSDSKNEATPAESNDIFLDRTVARVDAPSANVTTITSGTGTNAAKTKNVDAVKSIDFTSYAVANLSNKAYVTQNWENNWAKLNIPNSNSYYKKTTDFGTTYANTTPDGFFGNEAHNYMFENTVNNEDNATSMYFCYTATLDDSKLPSKEKDFTDGTFYRYDKKIYTSLQQIWDDSSVAWPFVIKDTNAKMTVAEALALIQNTDGSLKAQADLSTVRQTYGLDIYEGGKMYYKTAIQDEKYHPEGYYSILRNSVYKLTVNNVYDLGKDVPNGPDPDDKNKNYYMKVTVVVNDWVVNNQNVDLK